jgi:hypothetical protein
MSQRQPTLNPRYTHLRTIQRTIDPSLNARRAHVDRTYSPHCPKGIVEGVVWVNCGYIVGYSVGTAGSGAGHLTRRYFGILRGFERGVESDHQAHMPSCAVIPVLSVCTNQP